MSSFEKECCNCIIVNIQNKNPLYWYQYLAQYIIIHANSKIDDEAWIYTAVLFRNLPPADASLHRAASTRMVAIAAVFPMDISQFFL